jgi:hypothetical protein
VEICLSSWMARGLVAEMANREDESVEEKPAKSNHSYHFNHIMLWRVVLQELAPLQRLRLDERILEARSGALHTLPVSTAYRNVEELGD